MAINDKLFDRAVIHAHFLQGFNQGEVERITSLFNKRVLPDILKRMTSALNKTRNKTVVNRLKALEGAIRQGGDFRQLTNQFAESMRLLADSEAKHGANVLAQATAPLKPLGVEITAPNPATLRAIVTRGSIRGGTNVKGWFKDLERKTSDRIMQQMQIGLVEGESVRQLVDRIRGTAGEAFTDGVGAIVNRHINTLVRTVANNVSTKARQATALANNNVIKGIRIVATLDAQTTDICMSKDGLVVPEDSPQDELPPFHWGCRSTISFEMKSVKEMGLGDRFKEVPESTRASINGQVSRKTDYEKWLKGQPNHVQDRALGVRKAQLFREGKITVKDLVNSSGKSLTLKQLGAKEGIKIPDPKLPKRKKVAQGVFEPADTLKGAQAWGRQNFRTYSTYEGYDVYGKGYGEKKNVPVDVNYTGVSVKTANSVNKALWDLQNEYPRAKSSFKQINTSSEMSAVASVTGKTDMKMNLDYFGKGREAYFKSEFISASKTGHWPEWKKGANPHVAIMTHEFAHTLWTLIDTYTSTNYKIVEGFLKIEKNYYSALKRAQRTRNFSMDKFRKIFISRYAEKNSSEFVAEAFVDYYYGANPSPYSKKVVKLLKELFGKEII